jgi:hypothetical protein
VNRLAVLPVVLAAAASSAGCGSAANPPAASSQASAAVAFSQCMRAHGVQRYPDPGSDGALPKESVQQLGVSVSRFAAAQSACRHLLPNGGSPPTPAEVQQVRAEALLFARCVRAHGVPGFPDPASDGRIPDPSTVGIDQGSPAFEAANRTCGKYRPPYMPSNAAYNTWARTHGG